MTTNKDVKTKKSTKKHISKKRVRGYWVYTAKGGAEARYVKGYLRKRPKKRKKRLVIRQRLGRPTKDIPPAPPGYVFERKIDYFAEHPEAEEVEAERVVYTYKLCCLVELSYKYTVSFKRFDDVPEKHYRTIQYYHTQFMNTVKEATLDLHEKVVVMRAFGDVQFVSVDLYRVSGQGMLRERNWELLESYIDPSEVPDADL